MWLTQSIYGPYKGWHDPYMQLWYFKACNSIRADATKICRGAKTQSEQVLDNPCLSRDQQWPGNPFSPSVALVPTNQPWLDGTEWGVFRHTHLHKGSESGCFAEIDPRIDLRIVGLLSHLRQRWRLEVGGGRWRVEVEKLEVEECRTTERDFGTKLVYRD